MDDSGTLMNLDKRCGYDVTVNYMFLKTQRILKLLKIPQWSPVKFSWTNIEDAKAGSTCQLLNKLPQELIDAIVEVVDTNDILPLSLTCGYFFRLLAPRAQELLKMDSAPWAGDRIVIAGKYFDQQPDDHAFSNEEIRDIETIYYTEGKKRVIDRLGDRSHFYTTFTDEDDELLYSEWTYAKLSGDPHLENPSKNASASAFVGVHRDALRVILYGRMKAAAAAESDFKLVSRLLNNLRQEVDKMKYFPDPTYQFHCANCRREELKSAFQDAQVLRNLTTKEYLRSDALNGSDGYHTLASLIFRLAQWTDAEPGDSPDYHGRWAGHRFDVAMLEDVQGHEWQDATETLVEELEAASNEIGYWDEMLPLEEQADGARMFAKERWEAERLL